MDRARWRTATRTVSRSAQSEELETLSTPAERSRAASDAARKKWKRVGEIARRAGGDDPVEPSEDEDAMSPEERRRYQRKKMEQRAEREKTAKMMDLQYFLEMVDSKHRYGSNLRSYHDHWKKSDTTENFFYWLDFGEGKEYEHPRVTRDRLDREQVRYLSREERMSYLAKIDSEGRLVWAKNGERINTTQEFKDSMNGIVPKDDPTSPSFGPYGQLVGGKGRPGSSDSSSSSSSSESEHSGIEGEHYVNEDLRDAKGLSKIKYVSAAALLNHLLRGSVKPHTWIFVADTSFRLYVGIKQSGAFQHSSFLHGARISAAGLIKIKDGQLRRLSPLSGHYRPPTKNFRAFVHSLRDNGVDMSRVSISRSYAILVGLETYVKTRRKAKSGVQHARNAETKIMRPEEYEKQKEAEKDTSKSAEQERRILAAKAEREEAERKEKSWKHRVWTRIRQRTGSLREGSPSQQQQQQQQQKKKHQKALSMPGQDVESSIPPAGKRDKVEPTC
ncbi:unnamed protein product [Periconia digitata]|uniref:IQ calmodulin-binding motif protein n=1 Tax=Periconia digitata TaxID=1303443 RepID=A0A9W4U4N6_9PLEO|nr:unnamed protein product [Periconia digitata]